MGKRDIAQADLDLVSDIGAMTHDPLAFVLYAFPWGSGELAEHQGPRQWQRRKLAQIGEMLRAGKGGASEAVQMAISSGHGIGKSALVSWVIYWAMATHEDCRGVVTANTEKQLTTKTWAELAKWHRLAICSHWFELTATALFLRDANHAKTWRIDMVPWSERNTEAFAGLHNAGKRVLLVFDEASAIPDVIWEVSEGALTDANTEILWLVCGNPTRNTGRFRECFGRLRHRWRGEQIDSRDVEGTNKAQMQKWADDYGEDSDFVKVRVRGMFPSASARQFIAVEDADAAYGRQLRREQYEFAPVILTCDPAWEGGDELVIGKRQGLKFDVLRVIPKNDNDIQVANLLANLEDQHQADAVFVDGGYGTGIVSAGKTLGRDWRIVWFSGAAADPGCANKRAEMWKLARDWLKEGGAIPKDPVLYADLIGPETVARLDGKILIEPKDAMKRRGLPSPNRGDALCLTFAYPVAKKAIARQGGRSAGRARIDEEEDTYA